MFKPESPFFNSLGKIWEVEAQLEELASLLIPESNKTKNPLIADYVDKICSVCSTMKSQITVCINEMEDTRKEMFRVAKLMLKMKEGLASSNKL